MVVVLDFLLGILFQMGHVLAVQFLNFGVLWQVLPIYTTWFAALFITRGKEYEDEANRFMNGFALLWVGFQLGEYLIANIFTDPLIIYKIVVTVGLFAYAIFIMRLVLLGKNITRYIARIGEISAINVAALLFIQDILFITGVMQFFHLIIGFVLLYMTLDVVMTLLTNYIWKRMGKPAPAKEEEAAPAPTTAPVEEEVAAPTPTPVEEAPTPAPVEEVPGPAPTPTVAKPVPGVTKPRYVRIIKKSPPTQAGAVPAEPLKRPVPPSPRRTVLGKPVSLPRPLGYLPEEPEVEPTVKRPLKRPPPS